MKKIYIYSPAGITAPFLDFLDGLDEKMQKKIVYVLKSMAVSPGKLSEPQVKHFSIERYKELYELREKIRVMVRIIFTLDVNGNVILLHPFIKRHKRNTNQALEESLVILREIRRNPELLQEYDFNTSNQKIMKGDIY